MAFLDSLSQAGGGALGLINYLLAARHGQLGTQLAQRTAALGSPATRAQLESSPFLRGFYGVGTRSVQDPNQPSQITDTGVTVPGYTRELNLPPLDPDTQVKQLRAEAKLRLIGQDPQALAYDARAAMHTPYLKASDFLQSGLQDFIIANGRAPKNENELIGSINDNLHAAAPGVNFKLEKDGSYTLSGGPIPNPIVLGAGDELTGQQLGGRPIVRKGPEVLQVPENARVFGPGQANVVPPAAAPGTPPAKPGPQVAGPSPIPGKVLVEKPSTASVQMLNAEKRLPAARAGILQAIGAVPDPATGKPILAPDGTPLSALDALPGGRANRIGPGSGDLGALVTSIPGLRTLSGLDIEVQSKREQKDQPYAPVFSALRSLKGTVANTARVMGEVGNLNEQEQARLIEAYTPIEGRDTFTSGRNKALNFIRLLDDVEKARAGGASADQLRDLIFSATADVERAAGSAGGSLTPTTATTIPETSTPTTTLPPTYNPQADLDLLNGRSPRSLRRR